MENWFEGKTYLGPSTPENIYSGLAGRSLAYGVHYLLLWITLNMEQYI